MADLADISDVTASVLHEAAIAEIVAKARGRHALTCDICGEDLEAHRQPFGRCYECQHAIEIKEAAYGR